LVVEKEEERNAFVPEDYWVLWGELSHGTSDNFKATHATARFKDKTAADIAFSHVRDAKEAKVTEVVKKSRTQRPPAPFNTTSLQAAAAGEGLAPARTMRLAESLRYKARRDNVIVLCEPGDNPGQFHQEVVSSLDSLKIPYTIVRAGAGRGAAIKDHLIQGRNNHVIITTEKESIAADAVRSTGMLAQSGNYNITGYASHRIRRFESIDQELLQRMNAHFSMGYFVDYNDEAVKEFVRSYRALYNAEPGNFAFQGHDIAYYFIKALQKYGSDMINGIDSYKEQLLQLSFDFDRRTGEGGMFNEATRNVVYASGGISLRK
jgi:hypothetical protein